jgi:hypothetical protein
MIRRVHLCDERNGGHFQHLLQENGIIKKKLNLYCISPWVA